MAETHLIIKNLDLFTPDRRTLLRGFELEVQAGEAVIVTGCNGSGKTTLLRSILGSWPHYAGQIQLNASLEQLAYLPQVQTPEVHMPLSLRDVLSLSIDGSLDVDEVERIGLLQKSHLDLNWNGASGGEKKRALLTRVFLNRPKMIFLDEPFNHLDQDSHDLIGTGLQKFIRDRESSLVIVSHHATGANFFGDAVLKRVKL